MGCRNLTKGKQALDEIQSSGIQGTLSLLQLDVTDDDSISAAVDSVGKAFGRVDVFISNAGTASVESSGRARLEAILSTNTIGAMLVTEAFTPLLLQSNRPCLIQVSSGLSSFGLASDPLHPAFNVPFTEYRMSKAALNMMTIQMNKQLAPQNVRVFAFCPGLVRSRLRGESEEAISYGGRAGDPLVSGRAVLDIIEGKRDVDAGKLVHKDGIYPW